MTFDLPGFQPVTAPAVALAAGEVVILDRQLGLAPLTETITVVETSQASSLAVVVYACEELMAGDGIEPFDAAPQLTDGSAGTQTFDDPARILFGADGCVMGAPPQLMVIDHGSALCFRWCTVFLRPLLSPN
jgi:hypothetical protein